MGQDLTSLSDYAALQKLAAALWQQDSSCHGAAIMVGAGFSRSFAFTGDLNKRLPIWNDFSKSLSIKLESNSTDPLRLAEEYCAFFGKSALHDLIKTHINDTAWKPGKQHASLLELPWSEVLTTNWDTLLERASEGVHHPVYNIVTKQADLSSARSPRIVKLHGTVNVTEDLVFTQEDYRRYPTKNAALVNFARQVFIENELCLLGFSGEDPNFLQWAGWVRDHLESNSRRIYLVGALSLNSSKRRYLESINVAPIDLGELVTDYDDHDVKHAMATEIFIEALRNLKPKQAWEWQPTQLHRTSVSSDELDKTSMNVGYASRLLERKIPDLQADRVSYPGWLICPTRQRWELQNQINDPFPTIPNLRAMESDSRAKILYEIAWRHDVTYNVIPPWLAQDLFLICDPRKPCILSKKQQLELASFLMKSSRWFNNEDYYSIEQKTVEILESNLKYWPQAGNELSYHRALVARDAFDYSLLEQQAEKIIADEPLWKLKKASLLAELGEFEKGGELISEAHREFLSQHRQNRNSIYILSRLAWAHWLMRSVEIWAEEKSLKAFSPDHQAQNCNPWDHIEHIQSRISKALDKQREKQSIQPSFEPGRYIDNSKTKTLSNEIHPLLLLEGISSSVGVPMRWTDLGFIAEPASRLAELNEIDGEHRFSLAIRAASSDTSDVIKKVFSRTQIACLPIQDAVFLLNQCMSAILYWSEKWISGSEKTRPHAIGRLRVFIEVLARASVRATPEQAKEIFRLAISLGKKPKMRHFWLFDSLRHLIEFALEAIPHGEHHELLLDALTFPLQSEIGTENHLEWPNPIIKNPGNRDNNTSLDRRIDEIIDSVWPCSAKSAPALLRLLPLVQENFLTEAEGRKLADKVWGANPDYQKLPNTGLFTYALLLLPSGDKAAVKGLVRRYLFESAGANLFNRATLTDIINASQAKNITELPQAHEAADYFEKLTAWRASPVADDRLEFPQNESEHLSRSIGMALSRSVVPMLSADYFTEENFQKLQDFYVATEAPETLIAFVFFAASNDNFAERVERLIRQGFQSKEAEILAYASYALLSWRKCKASEHIDRLILRFIYIIGSNRAVGLSALLWTAKQMCDLDYLSDAEIESLAEITPILFDHANYKNISPSSRESVSASLIRAACAALTKALLSKGVANSHELRRVSDEAIQDALPEVRFA